MASRRKRDHIDKHIDALPAVIVILLVLVWFRTGNLSLVVTIYFVNLVALFGTGYYLYRRQRRRFFESGIEQIDQMSGITFEKLLLEYFKAVGYKGNLTAEKADYGADLVLKKDSIKYVVQAKRWKEKDVGIEAVQQVIGAIPYYAADKGMVIITSYFTKNAKRLAKSSNVELWDRKKLIKFLSEAKGSELIKKIDRKETNAQTDLLCPRCGNRLVLISGKNGLFNGCSGYPSCRYSQNADL